MSMWLPSTWDSKKQRADHRFDVGQGSCTPNLGHTDGRQQGARLRSREGGVGGVLALHTAQTYQSF
jgi:hypothetical protein